MTLQTNLATDQELNDSDNVGIKINLEQTQAISYILSLWNQSDKKFGGHTCTHTHTRAHWSHASGQPLSTTIMTHASTKLVLPCVTFSMEA